MFLGEKSASMYMEAGGDGYEVRPRSTEIVVATDVHAWKSDKGNQQERGQGYGIYILESASVYMG